MVEALDPFQHRQLHRLEMAPDAASANERLRELEQENARLKKLLAKAELDKAALKELVQGEW